MLNFSFNKTKLRKFSIGEFKKRYEFKGMFPEDRILLVDNSSKHLNSKCNYLVIRIGYKIVAYPVVCGGGCESKLSRIGSGVGFPYWVDVQDSCLKIENSNERNYKIHVTSYKKTSFFITLLKEKLQKLVRSERKSYFFQKVEKDVATTVVEKFHKNEIENFQT